jgi:hypothetical protein
MIKTFCVALLLGAFASGQQGAPGTPSPAASAAAGPCCYNNPQQAGGCSVQPGGGETCASILAFLNNPQSQGKSYCGNTSIRGGWKIVKCATPKATPTPTPSPTPR